MEVNEQKNNITEEDIMSQKIEEAIEPVINSKLTNKQKVEQVGQVVFAFILTLILIVSGVFLTIKGFPWVGVTIFGTTIMGVVLFITGKTIKQEKSKEEHLN